jgi:type I restriction enzyme M protein
MVDETTIKSILDLLRQDSGFDSDAQRLGQLAWMMFLKILDDRAMIGDGSLIPEHLRWRNWPIDQLALLDFINHTLFPGLLDLAGTDPFTGVVRAIFMGAENRAKNSPVLRLLIDKLNRWDFSPSGNQQTIARIYEQVLGELHGIGETGQDYTPRAVIQFMVEQVDPKPGETVLDPACGAGGFLAGTVEYLRQNHEDTDADERTIEGIEKNPLLHLLCVINLILHGIEAPTQIHHATALGVGMRDHFTSQPADVILTNPPFSGMEAEGLKKHFPAEFWTRETADLFLYRIITFLRPGGRAAVVVPDGLLSGEGVKTRLKEKLLQECNLHTVIRLPSGVFSPYTDLETNILFFTKGEPTREVWYYEHPSPAGATGYTKTRPLRSEDLEPARAWWHDREETRQAWKVSIKEIKARNYNLDLRRIAADAGQAPSRLSSLKLHGFRGFGSLDLTLPKQGPAVLIGVNGAGKSTVLQAIAILLSSFTTLASGAGAGAADIKLGEGDVKEGAEGATLSAILRVGEKEQRWERFASASRVAAPSDNELAQAQALRDQFLRFETVSVPVLCFYPATRRIGDGSSSRERPFNRFPQLEAYDGAFAQGLGPFQDFLRWFRQEEDIENEMRLRHDASDRNPRLQVIRRAVEGFLSALGAGRFTDLRMERFSSDAPSRVAKPAVLVLEKDGVHLWLDQLSEGERGTILLVSDLARRFAEANPAREDPLQGEGIVLIDDLERDLHPGWQRAFLPALCATFPGCQFIVSTHSPQVLGQVHKENVFIFEDFKLVRVAPYTFGHDANSILGEVFGLPERPKEIEDKIRQASILIDEERVEEARAALDELLVILGDHDIEVVRLRTVLSFVETPVVG